MSPGIELSVPEPADLSSLGRDEFARHLGTTFEVPASDGLVLTLVAADAAGHPRPGGRHPFSLIFTGPRVPLLDQRIHTLVHASLGRLDLFLVPIEPSASSARYEAIFA